MLKKSIKHLMKRWCGVDSCSGYQSNFDIDTRCPRTSVENRFVYSVIGCLCLGIKGKW